jgi:hypothetical protein
MVWTRCICLPGPDRIGGRATETLSQLGQTLRDSYGGGGGHAQLDRGRLCRLALASMNFPIAAGTLRPDIYLS